MFKDKSKNVATAGSAEQPAMQNQFGSQGMQPQPDMNQFGNNAANMQENAAVMQQQVGNQQMTSGDAMSPYMQNNGQSFGSVPQDNSTGFAQGQEVYSQGQQWGSNNGSGMGQEAYAQGQPVHRVQRTGKESDIITVDPTKSKKHRERQGKSSGGSSGSKKKVPKFVYLLVGVVVIIAGMMLAKKMVGMTGGKTSYTNILSTITDARVGSFKYVINVTTSPVGESASVEMADSSPNDSSDSIESSESELEDVNVEETEVKKPSNRGLSNTFVAWTNSEGVEVVSWKYPKYQVTFDGIVSSTDPYTADFTVSLATEYNNSELTRVIAIDNNYYIDINMLRSWLVSSQDSYLMSLGNSLPQGSKYLVVPFDSFKHYSRYAETSELEYSAVKGIDIMVNRGILLKNSIMNASGMNGLKNCFTEKDGTYFMSISGDDAQTILKGIRNTSSSASNFYKSYIETATGKGLYDESQSKQALRETDNIVHALTDFMVYMNTENLSDMGLTMHGEARSYKNSNKNDTYEASLNADFTTDDRHYNISLQLVRTGDRRDIAVPTEGLLQYSDEQFRLIESTFNGVVDYLNPSTIKLGNTLEQTPERIAQTVKESLIQLVNSIPEAGVYLTPLTVDAYLDKYVGFVDDGTATTEDIMNAQIVKDFGSVLSQFGVAASGQVQSKPVESDNSESEDKTEEQVVINVDPSNTPKFPELIYEDVNIKIIANIDEKLTDSNIVVMNMDVTNLSEGQIVLDTTNFSLRTLLSSIYPSNNYVLLHNYDNSWRQEDLVTELTLSPKSFDSVTLYYVISDDAGYMDLWFGETKLGEVIAY